MAEMTPQQFADWVQKELTTLQEVTAQQAVLIALLCRSIEPNLGEERSKLVGVLTDRLTDLEGKSHLAELYRGALLGLRALPTDTGPEPSQSVRTHLRLVTDDPES